MSKAILAPAAVLVLWSLVVLMWMAFTRFGAVKEVPKEKLRGLPKVGGRGQNLEGVLPEKANWASHNYTHLMEQPTLFYATVLMLALMGQGVGLNLTLAWAYVGLRIVHSVWQITVNTLPIRFGLFIASTLCLVVLGINALLSALA